MSSRSFQKGSSGFIRDMDTGGVIQPSLVKLSDEDCWNFYMFNEWANSVVDRIVVDCVKVVPKVVPKDPSKKLTGRLAKRAKEIENFLDNPNDNKESFQDIRKKICTDILVFGRASMEKVLTDTRKLAEIYALYSPDIKICADKHGNIPTKNAYVMNPDQRFNYNDTKKVYFDIDELIYMILRPTSRNMYGSKPMDTLANAIAADIVRAEYNVNYFLNNGMVSGILGMDGMSKTDLKRFKAYWSSNFKGYKNAHKIAAVNTPVNWTPMNVNNRDMQFQEYGEELRTKIFSAYKMQPVVMGVVDKSTGKLNTHEQVELYKDGALRPILSLEAYYYTQEIVQMGFGIKDLKIDFSGIDLTDVIQQSMIDSTDVASAIITINEARANRGKSPVAWGDTPVSVLPGGVQIDPDTGKITGGTGSGTDDNSDSEPKDDDKSILKNFLQSCKLKAVAVISYSDEDLSSKVKDFQKRSKSKQLIVNGKNYYYDDLTLPIELKRTMLNNLLDRAFSPSVFLSKSDSRYIYLESLGNHMKYIIFDIFLKGIKEKSDEQIDKFINATIKSQIAIDLF